MLERHIRRCSICVCVCTRVHASLLFLFNDLTQWARTELEHSFFGHLASGTMPSQPQSEQTWRHTHTHTYFPPFTLTLTFRFCTTGPPLMCIHTCTSPHTNTNTLIMPPARKTLLVCVWNERRVVLQTTCLKKKSPAQPQGQTSLSHAIQWLLFSHCLFSPCLSLNSS